MRAIGSDKSEIKLKNEVREGALIRKHDAKSKIIKKKMDKERHRDRKEEKGVEKKVEAKKMRITGSSRLIRRE